MPDEPTPGPGSAMPPAPTFRTGVERVDDGPERPDPTPDRAAPEPSSDATDPSRDEPDPAAPGWMAVPPSATAEPGPSTPDARPAIVPPRADPGASEEPEAPGAVEVVGDAVAKAARHVKDALAAPKVRARKVHRVVRHVEPWSVLKLSLLFYAALFGIICVASALLWGAARGSGSVEKVESFITSVGGFGNCEPIDGEAPSTTTTTTTPPGAVTTPVDQINPTGGDEQATDDAAGPVADPGDDEDCREGEELVGEFKFDDTRIFEAFVLGGIVLVLAGSAANVVIALLFNLMSDLTGGLRVTVLEEEPPAKPAAGSPGSRRRG